MYDIIIEVFHALWKNGFSLTALGTAAFVLLKQKRFKKKIGRFLPWLLDDDSEVKAYINNQHLIMERLGIKWNGPESQTPIIQKNSNKSLQSSWGKTPKRRMVMKNKLKSRKFWMAVISAILVVLNEGLDLGISTETVLTFAGLVATFILGEAVIDAKRAGKESTNEESKTSTEHFE